MGNTVDAMADAITDTAHDLKEILFIDDKNDEEQNTSVTTASTVPSPMVPSTSSFSTSVKNLLSRSLICNEGEEPYALALADEDVDMVGSFDVDKEHSGFDDLINFVTRNGFELLCNVKDGKVHVYVFRDAIR